MAIKPIRVRREYHYAGELHSVETKAGASEIKRLLGLDPKKHFPSEGMPGRDVQALNGTYFLYVTAAAPPVLRSRYNFRSHQMEQRPVKRSTHRVFAVCDCGKHVPAGRLHQHVCKS